MNPSHQAKDPVAERLRQIILQHGSHARETERAEADLTALSFESVSLPNRHVWVSTFQKEPPFLIDLEDWNYEGSWDNSVAQIEASTIDAAAAVSIAWLAGKSLKCLSDATDESVRVIRSLGDMGGIGDIPNSR